MSKNAKQDKGVTRRELAELLDCDMRTISKWQEEGLPVLHHGRGGRPSRYDEAAVRAWLQAREEFAKTPGAALDLVQERARKERWQGLLAEQTFNVRARKLLPADEIEQQLSARVNATRTKLLSWQTILSDAVFREATLNGLPGVEAVLKKAVHEVLRELASMPPPAAGKHKSDAA